MNDEDGRPVDNATVTLWAVGYDKGLNEVNIGRANISGNPALSSDGNQSALGTYVFYKVPRGKYNVTAEKDGSMSYVIVTLGPGGETGTATHNIQVNGTVSA